MIRTWIGYKNKATQNWLFHAINDNSTTRDKHTTHRKSVESHWLSQQPHDERLDQCSEQQQVYPLLVALRHRHLILGQNLNFKSPNLWKRIDLVIWWCSSKCSQNIAWQSRVYKKSHHCFELDLSPDSHAPTTTGSSDRYEDGRI